MLTPGTFHSKRPDLGVVSGTPQHSTLGTVQKGGHAGAVAGSPSSP